MPIVHELVNFFSATAQLSPAQSRALAWHQFFQALLHKGVYFFLSIVIYRLAIQFRPSFVGQFSDFQVGMLAVIVFFLIQRLTIFLTTIGLTQFLKNWHSDSVWIVAGLTRLVVFSSIYVLNYHWWFLVLAAVAEGVHSIIFWTQYLPILKQKRLAVGSDKILEKENVTVQFLAELGLLLIPSLVGFFAFNYGLEVILLIGVVVTLLSTFTLLPFSVVRKQQPLSWATWKSQLHNKSSLKETAIDLGAYLHHALFLLWPVYVFLLLKNIDAVGFLYTISLFIAILISFFVGTYLTKMQKKHHFYLTSGVMSLLWLARASGLGVVGILLADATERLTSRLHWQLFHSLRMMTEKKSNFQSEIYSQITSSGLAVFFWLIIAGIVIFTSYWPAVFIFAAVGVSVSMIIQVFNDKKISRLKGSNK